MAEKPLIAVPKWRAPTAERTKYYYDSIEGAGAAYVVVEGDDLPEEAGALLITGGVDVDPALYGEKKGPKTDTPHKERDANELRLLRQALERDIAVLCVCRGHQLLNVAFGGSILQDIEGSGHKWHDDAPQFSSRYHTVRIIGESRLAGVYGPLEAMEVNSRHHQGVTAERVGDGLVVTATSPDGFVEAVESARHRWVMGVQWHPERPEMHPASGPLWAAFAAAAGVR
jgi:putative glutamine amidotransferase